jgi:hypothetical protein
MRKALPGPAHQEAGTRSSAAVNPARTEAAYRFYCPNRLGAFDSSFRHTAYEYFDSSKL